MIDTKECWFCVNGKSYLCGPMDMAISCNSKDPRAQQSFAQHLAQAAIVCPCYKLFEEGKVNIMSEQSLTTFDVTIEIKGKMHTREVEVKVPENDKGFCSGHVGAYHFYWRPKSFPLPMLKLGEGQLDELYEGCADTREKSNRMKAAQEQVKQFLMAYKEMKAGMKTTELNGTIPVNPGSHALPKSNSGGEHVPDGFSLVGENMFEGDRGC